MLPDGELERVRVVGIPDGRHPAQEDKDRGDADKDATDARRGTDRNQEKHVGSQALIAAA